MKLVNVGPGELSDRLTILALKILFGTAVGRDIGHFQTEQTVLLTQIRSRTLNGKWFSGVIELGAVNAALWHAEDDLRVMRGTYTPMAAHEGETPIQGMVEANVNFYRAAARLAFRIQALNDQRAELIHQINVEAGDGGGGKEKL